MSEPRPMDAATHDALRDELRKEANRICIDAEYTGRQHMEMGRWWRQRATWIGLPAALIAAAASGGAALSALLGWGTALTVVLGFAGAIAGAVRAFFKPEEQAEAHASKGAACLVSLTSVLALVWLEIALSYPSHDSRHERAIALRAPLLLLATIGLGLAGLRLLAIIRPFDRSPNPPDTQQPRRIRGGCSERAPGR